ncbi:LytR/AlgR family response regulator transcription factor [Dyadobacter fermentans]|uniref:Two component transcriptional regulator, LytTR family n=1 Tax=Dyadobacter fermentans (strain ATCC 700827 / DSM 18053 / CIP 107007 / KCTC 52180 / NS114) TaxID=471854 RepID=C6VZU5_DYAFD|nr:LytTR family DNA-binding domain-containing protein [Dyadobacter fermentans]ACT93573.1 two component transcriptional regulator, LytTR family [Dyadobacter fermentans DSM 18053]
MKAVIIEDESLVARQLKQKISNVAADVEVVAILHSIKAARNWLSQNNEPDLMFMDIQLGDGLSFEIFDHFQLECPVIFTTAYDEYALRAFKVNGIDYILKPVDETDLKRALDKYRSLVNGKTALPIDIASLMATLTTRQPAAQTYRETFIATNHQQWVPLKTKDIACFSKDHTLIVSTLQGEHHRINNDSLEELEEVLDPDQFYRANRQHIVAREAIHRIQLADNNKIILVLRPPLKLQVDISREKAPAFKKWFDR